MSSLLLRRAEVDGQRVDLCVEGDRITALGPPGEVPTLPEAEVIDCAGGALLPGLHDHHVHLLAMAAAAGSLDVSRQLDARVRQAHAHTPPGQVIRAVQYDEVAEGPLDRNRLDHLAPGRVVRVQHRSGALWVLSSTALEHIGLAEQGPESEPPGVERDARGRPTGRLFRLDSWIAERLPMGEPNDHLATIGRRLASFGVTGVTDCTPTATVDYLDVLAQAVRTGVLPLTVATTGGSELAEAHPPAPLRQGPVKVVIPDHQLPSFDDLALSFQRAHRAGRPVAVHCVTRAALLLALAVWEEVGSAPGDRVEHASVTPSEVLGAMAQLSLTVVTQPAFIAARGDLYLSEVEADDRPDLYRCASLQAAGIPVGGSTDAPFGPDDPWLALRAATERRAPSGAAVGADQGLGPRDVLALFLGPLEQPGGPARQVRPGAPADLCLLDVPLEAALREPSSRHVAMTIAGGIGTFRA